MARVSKRVNGKKMFETACSGPFFKAPLVRAGMRVGLMGGSFDPPHDGHVHISLEAIKRLKLDQLWWLVSPGNPLKNQGPWPLDKRLQQCARLALHPRIKVTALEVSLGSPYTAQTLTYLTRRFADSHFVWLMGADNMASVHLWRDWREIFRRVPVAVLDRPGQRYEVRASLAAQLFSAKRLKEADASALLGAKAPAWTVLSIPLNYQSSTKIRERSHRQYLCSLV